MYKLSRIQTLVLIICSALIVIGLAFGVFTKNSYFHISEQAAAYDSAAINFSEDDAFFIDEMANKTDRQEAITLLNEYPYAFVIECIGVEHCFECTKFNAKIEQVVIGDNEEIGASVVLYQWVWFEKSSDNKLSFNTPDFSLPLIKGKKYLVFADKREYCPEYQKTLKHNEYSISLRGPVPTAYIINDKQKTTSQVPTIPIHQSAICITCVFQKNP